MSDMFGYPVLLFHYSQSRLGAMEDVKDKLLQFLLQHSQTVLLNSGCPIEKVGLVLILSDPHCRACFQQAVTVKYTSV